MSSDHKKRSSELEMIHLQDLYSSDLTQNFELINSKVESQEHIHRRGNKTEFIACLILCHERQ